MLNFLNFFQLEKTQVAATLYAMLPTNQKYSPLCCFATKSRQKRICHTFQLYQNTTQAPSTLFFLFDLLLEIEIQFLYSE